MKLYSPSNNFKLDKIIFTSKVLGKNIQHIEVPFDHKNKQFVAQFPNCRIPTLQTENLSYVFGSDSIILELFNQKMNTIDPFQQSQIYQWLELAEKELQNSIGIFVVHEQKIEQFTVQQLNKVKQNIVKILKIVDERLKLRTYLVSNCITPADIIIFFNFRVVKNHLENQMKNLTSLKRWMNNLQSIWSQLSQH